MSYRATETRLMGISIFPTNLHCITTNHAVRSTHLSLLRYRPKSAIPVLSIGLTHADYLAYTLEILQITPYSDFSVQSIIMFLYSVADSQNDGERNLF